MHHQELAPGGKSIFGCHALIGGSSCVQNSISGRESTPRSGKTSQASTLATVSAAPRLRAVLSMASISPAAAQSAPVRSDVSTRPEGLFAAAGYRKHV